MMTASLYPVQVKCYSGCKADERPVRFSYRDTTYWIVDIDARWVEQGAQAGEGSKWVYRVKAQNDREYLLVYDDRRQQWYLDDPR